MERHRTEAGKSTDAAQMVPVAWEDGFPIPAGARRNEALGGATSLAPGKNYTVRVFDTEDAMETLSAFYAHHLPKAKRTSEKQAVKFSAAGGSVTLTPVVQGTRITLTVGPR